MIAFNIATTMQGPVATIGSFLKNNNQAQIHNLKEISVPPFLKSFKEIILHSNTPFNANDDEVKRINIILLSIDLDEFVWNPYPKINEMKEARKGERGIEHHKQEEKGEACFTHL